MNLRFEQLHLHIFCAPKEIENFKLHKTQPTDIQLIQTAASTRTVGNRLKNLC